MQSYVIFRVKLHPWENQFLHIKAKPVRLSLPIMNEAGFVTYLLKKFFRGSSVVLYFPVYCWTFWHRVKTMPIIGGQKLKNLFLRVFLSFAWIKMTLDLSDFNEFWPKCSTHQSVWGLQNSKYISHGVLARDTHKKHILWAHYRPPPLPRFEVYYQRAWLCVIFRTTTEKKFRLRPDVGSFHVSSILDP